MSAISALTQYASVRRGFNECDMWREALGGAEPLRVAVCCGPLDAPEHMPAGSSKFLLPWGREPGRAVKTTAVRDGHIQF